jgi:hypothetical protein
VDPNEIVLNVNFECFEKTNCNAKVVEENFLKGFLKFKPKLQRDFSEGRFKIKLHFLGVKELDIFKYRSRPKRLVDKRTG